MTEDIESNRTDHYRDCCAWLMLARTPRMAWSISILLLATLGALGTSAGWRVAERLLITDTVRAGHAQLASDTAYLGAWPGSRDATMCPQLTEQYAILQRLGNPPADPVTTIPYRLLRPLGQFLDPTLSTRGRLYYVTGGLWTLLVWSLFGAAIVRMAALWFGRDERVSVTAALALAREKVVAHLAACAMPLVAVSGIFLILMIGGLLARWSFGAVIVGGLWVIPLLVTVLAMVVIVGLIFGWPLMWGAISTECSDSFDGMSRAYAYTYHRPLQYVAYALFAAVVGVLGWLLVWFVSELIVNLTIAGVGAGAGAQRTAELTGGEVVENALLRTAHHAIHFWNSVVRSLASGYAFAYFWCAIAGIYLLLRREVDRAELDDIPEADGAALYGLPQLRQSADGMPTPVNESDDTMQP